MIGKSGHLAVRVDLSVLIGLMLLLGEIEFMNFIGDAKFFEEPPRSLHDHERNADENAELKMRAQQSKKRAHGWINSLD